MVIVIIAPFIIRQLNLNMNSSHQTPNTFYRQPTRTFGTDMTNRSTRTTCQSKYRSSNTSGSLSVNYLISYPELLPYQTQILQSAKNKVKDSYIKENYMICQSQITSSYREQLVGWMVQLQPHLGFKDNTLFLAVFIVDKYCESRDISSRKYQLLGVSALFMAGKYQEIKTPKLKNYVALVKNYYQGHHILDVESQILLTLDFEMRVMTSLDYLEEFLKMANASSKMIALCKYLLDLSLIDYEFCMIKPSVVSSAVVIVGSNKMREVVSQEWVKEFECSNLEIRKSMQMVEGLFLRREAPQFSRINAKYSHLLKEQLF